MSREGQLPENTVALPLPRSRQQSWELPMQSQSTAFYIANWRALEL